MDKFLQELFADHFRNESPTQGETRSSIGFGLVVIVSDMCSALLFHSASLLETGVGRYHSQKLISGQFAGVHLITKCVYGPQFTNENHYFRSGDIVKCDLSLSLLKDPILEPDHQGMGFFSVQNFASNQSDEVCTVAVNRA